MMISLTTEQQVTLLFRADTQPRRRVKRWLKDQGGEGVAAELDEALATAKTNEAAVKGAAELIRLATAADRQAAEECEREEVAHKAKIIYHAARREWQPVVEMVMQHFAEVPTDWSGMGSSETLSKAVADHGTADWNAVADYMSAPPESQCVDFSEDMDELFAQICSYVLSAFFCADLRSARANIEAQAVPGGRFGFFEYYRKTMQGDSARNRLAWDDREIAEAYLALQGSYSTSAWSATIVDREGGK